MDRSDDQLRLAGPSDNAKSKFMRKTFLTMTALSALVLISPALHDTAAAGPGLKQAIRIKPQFKVKVDRMRLNHPRRQFQTVNVPAIAPAANSTQTHAPGHSTPSVVSVPLPRQRPRIASDGTDKGPVFRGIDFAALLPLQGGRDAPDNGGKAGDGSISGLLGLDGSDDRTGSTGGGWDPLASADDLGGSSWDPLASIDGLDDTLWDPLGGVDDRTGAADGGWDPLGGLGDAVGDDYDWQSGWQDDSGWDRDGGGGTGKYHEFGHSPAADALMEEANESLKFVFSDDEGLVADDVTAETATEADEAEAKMWAVVGEVTSIAETAADAVEAAARCSQGVCYDSDGNPITGSGDDPDDDDDSDDAPTTDGGDSTPVPPEFDMGGGVPTDAAGNPIAPDLDRGDIDPAPEIDDLAGGRVITDATGNPIDPNIHGGDIDPAYDVDTDTSGGTINQGQIGGDIDWDYET